MQDEGNIFNDPVKSEEKNTFKFNGSCSNHGLSIHTTFNALSVQMQCCVSGTFMAPWIRDPGWVKIQDEQPGSYFREVKNNFLG